MFIQFGVTLSEHFGTCGHPNRLYSPTELQGEGAVPSDGSPLVDVSQPALPLASHPKIWLCFVCLLRAGKVVVCCWVQGLLWIQTQLHFHFEEFITSSQLYSGNVKEKAGITSVPLRALPTRLPSHDCCKILAETKGKQWSIT